MATEVTVWLPGLVTAEVVGQNSVFIYGLTLFICIVRLQERLNLRLLVHLDHLISFPNGYEIGWDLEPFTVMLAPE